MTFWGLVHKIVVHKIVYHLFFIYICVANRTKLQWIRLLYMECL